MKNSLFAAALLSLTLAACGGSEPAKVEAPASAASAAASAAEAAASAVGIDNIIAAYKFLSNMG